MADASIKFDGRIVTDPRFNNANGKDVANLRILAGRSRKLDSGEWETLSETAFEAAFWGEHSHLVKALNPAKGDTAIVTGTVTGIEKFEGEKGERLTIKVSGDGVRIFPKKQQLGGFGGQQSQGGQQGNWGSQQQGQQSGGWGSNPQQDAYGAQGQQVNPRAGQNPGGAGGQGNDEHTPPF